MNYITGKNIRTLREKKSYTQKQLGEKIGVSEKTISKWETDRGLPDISLLEPLAKELQISVVELLNGEYTENKNRSANMKKSLFYVCPVCGNVIHAMGEGTYSCCGIVLPVLIPEETDELHDITVERIEEEYYVTVKHEMSKEHYISFIAYQTVNGLQLVKLYPQQSAEAYFRICGRGTVYVYCNKDGLYQKKL